MCLDCIRQWREEHQAAMEVANEHMDASGVPEDSLIRGLADIQLACNAQPMLRQYMREGYPTPEQLMQ